MHKFFDHNRVLNHQPQSPQSPHSTSNSEFEQEPSPVESLTPSTPKANRRWTPEQLPESARLSFYQRAAPYKEFSRDQLLLAVLTFERQYLDTRKKLGQTRNHIGQLRKRLRELSTIESAMKAIEMKTTKT